MSRTNESNAPSTARRVDRSALLIPSGLAVLAIGQFLIQAGGQAWLGALRVGVTYFGPALMLSSESSGQDALISGAAISAVGLAGTLLGVYRLARAVDGAAALTRSSSSGRSFGASARLVVAGLLVSVAGSQLYQAGQLILAHRRFLDAVTPAMTTARVGAVVAVVGFGLLLLGIYRLVLNIQVAVASTRSSASSAA